MDDPEGTFITTKRDYSVFHWGFGKYQRRIEHDANQLPGLEVNEGFNYWANYCKSVAEHCSSTKNAAFTSAMNPLPKEAVFESSLECRSVFTGDFSDEGIDPLIVAYDPSDADMLQHYSVGAKVRYT
jgi:hypothetical protein